MITALVLGLSALIALAQEKMSGIALIPAGTFQMGDHHGFVDQKHGSDKPGCSSPPCTSARKR
ncbi:MAG: hypothetical protein NTY65_17125 [Planctomycetota bacterium]|nr:hypothetical protein [Planctomycetota bacterium]